MAEVTRGFFELEGAGTGQVQRFGAREQLSEPYAITVEIAEHDAAFDVAGALGKDATLTFEQDGLTSRRFTGLVWSVRSTDGHRGSDWGSSLELTLRPALHLMSLNRNSRIFQGKSVPEILEQLLGDGLGTYGRTFTSELRGTYEAREYCVQYQESDLAFVQRLMAEEGIFYSFDFASGPEVLVLHDTNDTCVEIPDPQLTFQPVEGRVALGASVSHFVRRRASTTNSVALHDWDWTGPRKISATYNADSAFPTLEAYEHGHGRSVDIADYDEGVRRYQSESSSRYARVRSEEKQVAGDVGAGRSGMAQLTPGAKLSLSGHPTLGIDGDYLLTAVVHRFGPEGEGDERSYVADLHCIPADVPFHPPPRPKPRILSVQTATVVGPSGEEIHTDPHGRVVVQFHWDREGANDEHSSCWVRVRQAWAGDGWGFLFLPRIGMEVVVSFLGGDPDRPLVTACVYNGNNLPPYPLPDEKTKSTIKTNSSKGGGGFNEYRFDDKAGSEQIFIHAQKDFNEVVEACHSTYVGGNQSNTVHGNQTQKIDDWQKEVVDIDQKMTVTKKRTVEVGGNFKEDIDTGEKRNVTGGSTEEIKAGETRTIVGTMTEEISDGEVRTVHGGLAEVVVGPFERHVTGGDANLTADGAFAKMVTGALTVTASAAQMKFDAKSGVIINADGPVTASGGPFIEWIITSETRVTKVDFTWGVVKMTGYGATTSTINFQVNAAASATSVTIAKAEAYAAKIELAVAKLDITGAKIETVGLFVGSGASSKKNKAFWFK